MCDVLCISVDGADNTITSSLCDCVPSDKDRRVTSEWNHQNGWVPYALKPPKKDPFKKWVGILTNRRFPFSGSCKCPSILCGGNKFQPVKKEN